MLRPRVGHIQFLNCLPLYYGLVKNHALLDIELVKGTPTELNRLLISGDLDISPISSIEYARHPHALMLLPDFTVSSDGEVKSILLISRYPIECLSGRKIALTSTSATSHVLLKLILTHAYGITAEYTQHEPSLEVMLEGADAALLIGDIALHHSMNPGEFYLYDLGTEWKRLTGKKMVYAVWAVTRRFTERNGELSRYVFDIFRKSMDYSLGNLEEIAGYAAKWEPFSPSFLGAYFRSLKFDFGSSSQAGLLHFYDMAAKDGHIEQAPDLEFFQLHPGVRT